MSEEKQDLRVTKTLRALKTAFLTLASQKKYRHITVKDLTNLAEVNRKTFYLHYDSMDAILMDIEKDFADRVKADIDALDQDDLEGAIRVYYENLNTDDATIQRLLYGEDYRQFFKKYTDDVLSADFFKKYYERSEYPDLIRGYFDSVTNMFTTWKYESTNGVGDRI